jgi:methyl-accepting chemotaxis protein
MAVGPNGDLEDRFSSVEELFEALKRTKQVIADQDEIIKQSKQNIEQAKQNIEKAIGIKRQANQQYDEIEQKFGALVTPRSTRILKVEDDSPIRKSCQCSQVRWLIDLPRHRNPNS